MDFYNCTWEISGIMEMVKKTASVLKRSSGLYFREKLCEVYHVKNFFAQDLSFPVILIDLEDQTELWFFQGCIIK